MVKPFNDFVFNSSSFNWFGGTSFGFHIIKGDDKQDGIRLATVAALRLEVETADKRLQSD
jgi:hypothetical protein